MLKELIIAIESYFKAHRFISKHRLWKWIIIPGLLYMILFIVGMYVFWQSSDAAVSYITSKLGIGKWVHQQGSDLLSFLFVMGELMVRLILIFFYFSSFRPLLSPANKNDTIHFGFIFCTGLFYELIIYRRCQANCWK